MRLDVESRYRDNREREGQDTTLTAASLIDAIITHQINQPSPNDRQSPAPSKSDRLFASFQRSSSHAPAVSIHNAHQQQHHHQQQQQQQHQQHNPVHNVSNMHMDDKSDSDSRGMIHKSSSGNLHLR